MHTDWSSLSLWFFWLTFSKNPPISSQQIRILNKTNTKIVFSELLAFWKVCSIYWYSIIGRGSFALTTASIRRGHGGDQFVALLRWYGSPGFFDRGLQLICIFLTLVSHFPLDKILYEVQVWWVCWASQAHQHHGHLTNFWWFWQCGQVAKSCWKMKTVSLKSWSAEGSIKCSKMSW